MDEESNLVSVAEAAKLLGIDRHNVLRAITEGHLPARKIVGRWTFTRADLQREIERRVMANNRGAAGAPFKIPAGLVSVTPEAGDGC